MDMLSEIHFPISSAVGSIINKFREFRLFPRSMVVFPKHQLHLDKSGIFNTNLDIHSFPSVSPKSWHNYDYINKPSPDGGVSSVRTLEQKLCIFILSFSLKITDPPEIHLTHKNITCLNFFQYIVEDDGQINIFIRKR